MELMEALEREKEFTEKLWDQLGFEPKPFLILSL